MDNNQLVDLTAWISEAGLAGLSEAATLTGFCERALAIGLPLARANVVIDTLHPVYEGRAFTWQREKKETRLNEFGRTNEALGLWERSPFYRLGSTGESLLRRRLSAENEAEFSIFADLRAEGITDYLAITNRFSAEGIIGDMDCVYSSWATDAPQGFRDTDIDALSRLMPLFALTLKSASLTRSPELWWKPIWDAMPAEKSWAAGSCAGLRIGSKRFFGLATCAITRGSVTRRIPSKLFLCSTNTLERSYRRFMDVQGDVLKLIGDGTLAIFTAADRASACHAALTAALEARHAVAAVNERRMAANLPTTDMYLGLHIGEVFYGNIGSEERLDFTVVGPAVNEVSRIASMCRSLDQPVLTSSAFASAIGEPKRLLVSVGRYALRGVGRPQDLFTLDRDREAP